MDVGVYPYPHGDPLLIDKIVNEFLSQGKFDKLRKECMSDADTKPAYQNLQQRVESTVTQFLKKQVWRPDLNKNQLRDSLRKHILESGFFDAGINRIVDQVVNPNVLATVFMPEVEEVVYNYLSIPRPNDRNHRRGENERHKPSGNENNRYQGNGNYDNDSRRKVDSFSTDHAVDTKLVDMLERVSPGELQISDFVKSEESPEDEPKKGEDIKTEISEPDPTASSDTNQESGQVKMEVPSDESQESLSRMGVERLQINETESVPVPDSDDSVPLEINEKSLSDSRDSDESILNQMSPISQGRLTPDLPEEIPEPKVEEKIEKPEEKKPLTFIGRIPKIKREDSESSKSSKTDISRKDLKHGYSSDESDSSKSYGKSDSDERRSKEAKKNEGTPQKEEKKHRDDSEKRKKHDDHHKRKDESKDRKKDSERSRDSKDRKRDKSKDRHSSKKSSSSSSRERSSSRHKSSHQSRHKDSRSKDHDRKKKEDEKKKSKSTDDHGKERNKKEDRRSTDRDSNERERDKATGSRSQGDERKREKDQKTSDSRSEKTQKEEAQVENDSEVVSEVEEVVIEMDGEWVPEDGIVILNEDWLTSDAIVIQESEEVQEEEDGNALDFDKLFRDGALTRVEFPRITDDFYVKFDSTGFKYFEEWEKKKLDCEEEFKEFVDEAEHNLDLISDDDSDFEDEFNFEEENRRTITNMLKGLGNFRRTIMFDPSNSEFYKWTNSKYYQKFRKKKEKKCAGRNESDESIKENIHRGGTAASSPDGEKENRERETKALHLKLLNRYKRRAMGHGKHRRRHRRENEFEGIKEKNENRSATVVHSGLSASNELLYKAVIGETENRFLGTNLSGRIKSGGKVSLVDGAAEDNPTTPGMMRIENGELCVGTLPESPDDDSLEQNPEDKKKENVIKPNHPPDSAVASKVNSITCTNLPSKYTLALHLPPSPDSDDIHSNTNGITPKDTTNKLKRIYKSESESGCTPKKQIRRNYSQKYDSQDLYKPRPVLNCTRKRGRERGSEPDVLH